MKKKEKTEIKIKTRKVRKFKTQKEKGQAPSLKSSETSVVERLAFAPSALRVLRALRLRHQVGAVGRDLMVLVPS